VGAGRVFDDQGVLAVRLARLVDRATDLQHIAAFGTARDAVDTLLMQQNARVLVPTPQAWDALCRAVVAAQSRITAAQCSTRS